MSEINMDSFHRIYNHGVELFNEAVSKSSFDGNDSSFQDEVRLFLFDALMKSYKGWDIVEVVYRESIYRTLRNLLEAQYNMRIESEFARNLKFEYIKNVKKKALKYRNSENWPLDIRKNLDPLILAFKLGNAV